MVDAGGAGKEKTVVSCRFSVLSVSSVLSVAECLFRVVRVPRLREGKISRFTGGISFFFVVFLRLRGNDCMKACLRRR